MTGTVVILSTADFNAAIWTNKQHLATRLAEHTRVIYIESLGLRQPRLSAADAKRVWSRAFKQKAPNATPNDVEVVKPHVIPLHRYKVVQALNARLLRRQIRRITSEMQSPTVLWTFSPVTYGIESYFDKVVYHSVDLLHTQPYLPHALLLEGEKQLTDKAGTLIASSTGVANHLKKVTDKPVILWENVADTSLYINTDVRPRVRRAVFAGNLTPTKIDFDLLTSLADAGIEVILAGPTGIDGTRAPKNVSDLINHPNINHVGNLKPDALAELLNSCTVGVIPYVLNAYTTGVFPMKVYEYLASGLAVVTTPLPSLTQITDEDIHVTQRENFVGTVTAALDTDTIAITARKRRAGNHSWETRTMQALTLLKS